jgi:DNA-binding TFAR19-related protein (PDSD5 family)
MPDDAELDGDDQQTLKEDEQHALDDDARERLRQVRWTKVGLFTEVVEAILELPELPGHSHFARSRSTSVTA